jgi:3-oxoacyl-[acyl-carrier-protein] synthase-3
MERVGIQNRRTILPLDYIRQTKNINVRESFAVRQYTNAKMEAIAARQAIERAGIKKEDIGLLISGTSTPDNIAPAEASAVATEIGIEVACFDLNSACSTFGMQVNMLMRMQPEELPPYILLVLAETPTKSINYSDRSSAVIFGDAAFAAVVSTTVPSDKVFVSGGFNARPSGWTKVGIKYDWTFHQDGNAVQGFAIRTTTECLKILQDEYEAKAKRFVFIGHQANLLMLKAVCERRGVAPERHWFNVDQFGNTACCSGPSVLSMHWNDIQPGDNIAMVIVGAGLAWAYMMLKVADR